ncbi:MAG: HDOD domain-containing protein [Lachnospiraceae bacterium]|nr:HDOD domain-containing protein [Lachnospiraceae bacterium]
MLATLIPLFDSEMSVKAYTIFAQRDNYFLDPIHAGTSRLDNAVRIEGLDIMENMGIHTLSDDKELFLPIMNVSIFVDFDTVIEAPHDKIVILMDETVPPEENYINRILELRKMGYHFAIQNIPLNRFGDYQPILAAMDFVLLDHTTIDIKKAKAMFDKIYPNLQIIAVNVNTQEEYSELKDIGGFNLYEGGFFRLPVHDKDKEIAPLKATYVELLRVVNQPDFDLTDAAKVIGHDTALVLSLLEMVNHMTVNSDISSVRHAAAMLGQTELKKWINTAVTKELCADKPSEITRLSLIRAKFAENLAPYFDLKIKQDELFLMGLFSVLNIILDKPMEEAIKSVSVSPAIADALTERSGDYAKVLDFIEEYENASWSEISRILVLSEIDMDDVYKAYLDSLSWYRDLVSI